MKLAARFVGRWPDGAPLVAATDAPLGLGGDPDDVINNFRYAADDPDGDRCPLGVRIRRSNPRDIGGGNDVRRHRILRRSISYGGPLLLRNQLATAKSAACYSWRSIRESSSNSSSFSPAGSTTASSLGRPASTGVRSSEPIVEESQTGFSSPAPSRPSSGCRVLSPRVAAITFRARPAGRSENGEWLQIPDHTSPTPLRGLQHGRRDDARPVRSAADTALWGDDFDTWPTFRRGSGHAGAEFLGLSSRPRECRSFSSARTRTSSGFSAPPSTRSVMAISSTRSNNTGTRDGASAAVAISWSAPSRAPQPLPSGGECRWSWTRPGYV